MHTHTPHIRPHTRAALLGTALLLLSCTKTVTDGPEYGDNAIIFTNIGTKAPVGSKDEIKSFSVWGWYADDAAGTNSIEEFDGTKVYENEGGWIYDDLKFWKSGKTYDFYALYPDTATLTTPDQSGIKAAESAAYDAAGNLTITNFDSTSGHDLMTASNTGRSGTNPPQSVAFTFSHELALVSFVGQSEGSNAQIISIKFSGVKNIGDYDASLSPEWTVKGNNYVYEETSFELPSVPTDIFSEIMVIPQSLNDEYKLTIEYEYKGIDGTRQTKELSLPDSVTKWEAGKSYRYTFTIVGDYILFSTPEVNAWSESSGGIIIVA